MLPVLLIVAVAGLLGAYGAQKLVDHVFDRWLLDAAKSLAQQVRFVGNDATIDLSPQARALLLYDVADRVYFEVVQEDRHITGQTGIPRHGDRESGQREGERAYDTRFEDKSVRVVSVPVVGPQGQRALVLLGETQIKRRRAHRDLLLTMLPLTALPLLAALVIGFAVRSTVQPLEGLAARWNSRSHESLQPLPADEIPKELLPFAEALNDLLARLRSMLERERQLAATAAHQLRTPLAGLQLALTRASEAQDLESVRAVLRDMSGTAQRTARLVQQLLALGRLDPELRGQLQMGPVDLVSLAQEVGESYVDAAMRKRIDLEFSSSAPALPLIAHRDLLIEALANLIDNAIRYTQEEGRVVIAVVADARGTSLSVADSGPGVPAHEREQVFERFVRGSSVTADGSGLGLAIVREIVHLHGGEIVLDQSNFGGALLTIRFEVDRH